MTAAFSNKTAVMHISNNTMKNILFTFVLAVFSVTLFAQNSVTCNKCNGSGSVRVQASRNCSSCKGTGTVIVNEIQTCPQCKGTAKMKVPKNGELVEVPCNYSLCRNGKITVPKTERCGACSGTGVDKYSAVEKCPKCNGTGKITQ